jgi:hypothetical protein
MIFFTTGNGSITNFPLRPDHKGRHHNGPLQPPLQGHGRERRRLPRRQAHGRARPGDVRAHHYPPPSGEKTVGERAAKLRSPSARLEADEAPRTWKIWRTPPSLVANRSPVETRLRTSSSPSTRSRPRGASRPTRSGSLCRRACAPSDSAPHRQPPQRAGTGSPGTR